MLNMFLVRTFFIVSIVLVCTLMVSDIGAAAFSLGFAGWALMECAGLFRSSRGDAHHGPED